VPKSPSANRKPRSRSEEMNRNADERFTIAAVSVISKHTLEGTIPD